MFLIKYRTELDPLIENHEILNDVKDVRDVILGITNNEYITNYIYDAVCNMTFCDRIDYPWKQIQLGKWLTIRVCCFDYSYLQIGKCTKTGMECCICPQNNGSGAPCFTWKESYFNVKKIIGKKN